MKKLKVGDRVRYELHADGNPRWADNHDGGGTGKYVQAVVERETASGVLTLNDEGTWGWPYPYEGDRPGYLELVKGDDDPEKEELHRRIRELEARVEELEDDLEEIREHHRY